MKGWSLLVEWKDGGSHWIPLKDLKESNPIEVAEYAITNKIVATPDLFIAFTTVEPNLLDLNFKNYCHHMVLNLAQLQLPIHKQTPYWNVPTKQWPIKCVQLY